MDKPRKIRESEIQRRFIAEANRRRGAFCCKTTSVGRRGLPDVIYVSDGYVTFVELKTDTGNLTPAQENCHKFLRDAGAVVTVLYGWEECQSWLRRQA